MAISTELEVRISKEPAEPSDLQPAAIESAEQSVLWWEKEISKVPLDDPMGMYLREIRRHPLLSPERERELAIRVQCARAAGEEDKAAFDELVNSNLRLVIKIAGYYYKRNRGALPLLDLIQEGNIGLMRGIDGFDPGHGSKVSTYVTHWIRQGISRAIRGIRLPVHLSEKLASYFHQYPILQQELGRDPTNQEMADELQVPEGVMLGWLAANQIPQSLDPQFRDEEKEGDVTITGSIAGARDTEKEALENNLTREIGEVLQTLTPRERTVLELYFGLGNQANQGMSLEQVGKRIGLTRERIRQIKDGALEKLRAKPGTRHLLEYLTDD